MDNRIGTRSRCRSASRPVLARLVSAQSELYRATGVQFFTIPTETTSSWHNAPRRQLVIHLAGELGCETSDGTRHFGPGSVFMAEDLTGQGHRSHTGPGGRTFMVVPVADDLESELME